MTSPTSFGNQHRPISLQVSPNTNSIFVTPLPYRSQQFTYDHTNTFCNVSLKFHFNSPQCQKNANTKPSNVVFSTPLDPDAPASNIVQSDFVQCTSAEIKESPANMSYGTAKIPNSINCQFNFPHCQTTVNPIDSSVNVSRSLDPDNVCCTFFDSENVQSASADIKESSVQIPTNSANVSYGTAKTPDNHLKRKFSSTGGYPTSPNHENGSSGYSQSSKPCPIVGEVFLSYEMVVQSYYDFASSIEFSVRLESTQNILDKETGQKILVMKRLCSKQGSPNLILPPTNGTSRKNSVSRYGCLANIKFKRIDRSDKWVTDSVNLDHNHPFTTPSKIRYLPINQSISHTSKILFSSLADVNVPVSQQTAYFSNQLDGPENMGCMTLDINNMVRDDRIDLKNYDVDLISK
ncbi:hypothetical protein ZOSMA_67G00100 [Zostera marina]|uniref:FAR1 domain-containing protein n=1 Tax=Zostera marina TaxID=29655 RepID=A0A0K9NRW2_ZOSMR|nr:hypothetical protein ZOSMA_67G00100 [Zostera marina]